MATKHKKTKASESYKSDKTSDTMTTENTDPSNYESLVVLTNKPKCKKHKNGFGQSIIPYSGKFSSQELDVIRKGMHDYCAARGLPVSDLTKGNLRGKSKLRGIWNELGKKLPHRYVQSIYRCGIRLAHPFKRGEWDEEELKELKFLHVQLGNKWAQIGKRLNRLPDCCRDKHREAHDDISKGYFTDEENMLLLKLLRKSLQLGEDATIEEMRKAHFEDGIKIPWARISKMMKTRSRLQCFNKFEGIMNHPRKKNDSSKRKRDTMMENTEGAAFMDNVLSKARKADKVGSRRKERKDSTPSKRMKDLNANGDANASKGLVEANTGTTNQVERNSYSVVTTPNEVLTLSDPSVVVTSSDDRYDRYDVEKTVDIGTSAIVQMKNNFETVSALNSNASSSNTKNKMNKKEAIKRRQNPRRRARFAKRTINNRKDAAL